MININECPPRSRAGRGHPRVRPKAFLAGGAAPLKKRRGQPTQNGRAGVEHAGNTSVFSDGLCINMSTETQRTLKRICPSFSSLL